MSQTISSTIASQVTLASATTITEAGVVISSDIQVPSIIDGAGPGTLFDYGTVSGTNFAVSLDNGGFVDVGIGGTLEALDALNMSGPGVSTLINSGFIDGRFIGAYLNQAVVTNTAAGTIDGGIQLTQGTVTNLGTESGAVDFRNGGTVLNLGAAAEISSFGTIGVDISAAPGYVQNQGQIGSVYLNAGGSVRNTGLIGGRSTSYGVNIGGPAAAYVDNSGTIVALRFGAGGTLTNTAQGDISGYIDGVNITGVGSISNSGTILGVGGIVGADEGDVGGNIGIAIGAGTVANLSSASLIQGSNVGVEIGAAAGSVLVTNRGSIIGGSASGIGLLDQGAGNATIINYGLISGHYAIRFGSGDDLLVLGAGSTLQGTLLGGSGIDTVEFASGTSALTITGLNTSILNISTFINNAASLTLTGANTLAPGAVFDNTGGLLNAGTLNIFGTLENSGSIDGAVSLGGLYFPIFSPDPSAAEFVNNAGGVIVSAQSIAVAPGKFAGGQPVTVINAGTIDDIASGGTAVSFDPGQANLLIDDPGSVFIGAVDGGAAAGSTVGSMLELGAGASIGTISGIGTSFTGFLAVSVAAGGTWRVENSTIASLIDAGTVYLDASNTASAAMIDLLPDADLVLADPLPRTALVEFSGTDATPSLTEQAGGEIANAALAPSYTIDLTGATFDPHGSVSLTTGNVLVLTENGTVSNIYLDPTQNLSGDFFHIASDGFNGTDIIESSVPCFLAGTLIRTPAGDRPVEDLRIGDLVVTDSGAHKPVKWIGRRTYEAPFPEGADIIPVVIAAGALGETVPDRDLYVSPLHGVLVEDVLVPAGALINGTSVRPCDPLSQIAYFHIETEDHDIILANGAPAETFIDENSRNMFDNAEEFYALYPGAVRATAVLCAPRLEFGVELERIRRKIALRAGVLLDQPAAAQVVGYLEAADRHRISGWAYAPAQPHVPLRLDILNRGALLARTIAHIPRPDVKQAGFGSGRCGFSVTLPAPLPALQRHEISVRLSGSETLLAGSPTVIDPGVSAELLKTGGLQTLIDAAVKGAKSQEQARLIGNTLELAGRKIKIGHQDDAPAAPRRLVPPSRPVALFLDQAWPTVDYDAGSNAVTSHIAAFQALGYDVVFCVTSGAPLDGPARAGCLALQELGVTCRGQDGAAAEAVIKELAAARVEVVYLHRLAAAAAYAGLVRHHLPQAFLIYAIADLHALRLERQAAVTNRPDLRIKAKAVRGAEIWAMQAADCVLTHSRAEAAALREAGPRINVRVVPWHVEATPPAPLKNRADIAFIGGAGHAPNFDAVTHLATDIMPLVWRSVPAMRVLVAGAGWPPQVFAGLDQRIVGIGHQPSLLGLLNEVRLTVAPLRFGAGIKGKVLTSLAAGTPCVMTTTAAEGLPLNPVLGAAVGDGERLADNILAVYKSKKSQRELATAGQDMIKDYFSRAHVVAALAAALGRPIPTVAATSWPKVAAMPEAELAM